VGGGGGGSQKGGGQVLGEGMWELGFGCGTGKGINTPTIVVGSFINIVEG
jgi:hypothetical protein